MKVQVWGAFSGATAISVIGGQRVRVRFPSELPPAYLGANGSFADEDEGVFNPPAANVVFDREVSELSWWQRQWLVWQIRRSGVLALPYSIPAESVVLDGSDAYIVICDRGLRYDYSRSLDHENVEPALKRILKAVGAI